MTLRKIEEKMIDDKFTEKVKKVEDKTAELTTQLVDTTTKLEEIAVYAESFPLILPELDDTARIKRAINDALLKGKPNVFLNKKVYNISDTIYGHSGLHLYGRNDFTTVNMTVKGRTAFIFDQKDNVGMSNIFVVGKNISLENTSNALAFNFISCTNVHCGKLKVKRMNVGLHLYRCDVVHVEDVQVEETVINAEGVTGYGVNTDGSKNVYIKTIFTLNCERHGVYIGASDPINFMSQNQNIDYINAIWTKGSTTPSAHQAGLKTFSSKNINVGTLNVEGLKGAVWAPTDVHHLYIGNIFAKNIKTHAVSFIGTEEGAANDFITFDNVEVIYPEGNTLNHGIVIGGYPSTEYLYIKQVYGKNCASLLHFNAINNYKADTVVAENCVQAIDSDINKSVGNIGCISIIGTGVAEKDYAVSYMEENASSVKVNASNVYTVKNTVNTTITDIVGGFTGKIIKIYFNTPSSTTTLQNLPGKISLIKGRNTQYKQYHYTVLIKNRGMWYEISNNVNDQVLTGTAIPTVIPAFVGQEFLDTSNKKVYKAMGITSASDWAPLN